MDKSILETMHESATGLHEIGLMNDATMREFDSLCLPKIKKYTARQIKKIRKDTQTSQAVFAVFLNISKSTVQQWERGDKKPQGSSLKLLSLVEQKGLDILS